jgi:hypothetical protein
VTKVNWKKVYAEAQQAKQGGRYEGSVLHVVPTRRKHDSGYKCFETYLVKWSGKNDGGDDKEQRIPYAVHLYDGNDVVTFGGLQSWVAPPGPIHMDIRMDGVIQLWADAKRLSVAVIGFCTCDVRVLP